MQLAFWQKRKSSLFSLLLSVLLAKSPLDDISSHQAISGLSRHGALTVPGSNPARSDASQNDHKSKGYPSKTSEAAFTMQKADKIAAAFEIDFQKSDFPALFFTHHDVDNNSDQVDVYLKMMPMPPTTKA